MEILRILRWLLTHPLNRHRRSSALLNYVKWQIGSRLVPGMIAVPFVDHSRLLVRPSLTGATGNVYAGLHEFEDMAFTLHLLRPEDTFLDVGANVGSYTVLAGGAAGAHCIAIEPVPSTYQLLCDNIRLNAMEARCRAENIALGSAEGIIRFTSSLDTENRVALPDDSATIEVRVRRLDDIVLAQVPTLIKIDTEGYESEVLAGAAATLRHPTLIAVIMEANESGHRYGFDESEIQRLMHDFGFETTKYSPFERTLVTSTHCGRDGNIIYVRNRQAVEHRIKTAPAHSVQGIRI
jgi:FkbM family methyltransferase